jgi:hypothetical protein
MLDGQIKMIKKEEETSLEKKIIEMENILTTAVVNVNVLEVGETEVKKKVPLAFNFGMSDRRNIEVKPVKKVDDFEEVPDPKIIEEDGEYKIIRETPLTEIQLELRKDDPVIPIPKDLNCPEKKTSKKDTIEEPCCHGDAMGNLTDAFEGKMVGGDLALKAKVLRDREKYIERIPFKEKKEKIEKHFKTNVDLILENGKIMSVAERSERNAIDRYCHRELKYEMEPYKWILVKLPNGKTKAIVVKSLKKKASGAQKNKNLKSRRRS